MCKDGMICVLVLCVCELIVVVFFVYFFLCLSDVVNYCFADGRVIDEASVD